MAKVESEGRRLLSRPRARGSHDGDEVPVPVGLAERVGKSIQKLERKKRNQEAANKPARPKGRPRALLTENHANNKNDSMIYLHEAEQGTTAPYAMRRLKVGRPDLYEKCLAGQMTANAAMVEAGYRKRQPPRRKPILGRIQALWQKADAAERQRIIQCRKFHIPPDLVVKGITAQRKPPEVRIWILRNQSLVGNRPPSTCTPHWPACFARR
jgi:hypothetical protein